MNSEEYIQEYQTISLREASRLCDEHSIAFSEYQKEYPNTGLDSHIDSKNLLHWLGY